MSFTKREIIIGISCLSLGLLMSLLFSGRSPNWKPSGDGRTVVNTRTGEVKSTRASRKFDAKMNPFLGKWLSRAPSSKPKKAEMKSIKKADFPWEAFDQIVETRPLEELPAHVKILHIKPGSIIQELYSGDINVKSYSVATVNAKSAIIMILPQGTPVRIELLRNDSILFGPNEFVRED